MQLHSGLFHLCLFVIYIVVNIYAIEKDPVGHYITIIKKINDIFNRAPNLLNEDYILKPDYTGNYVATNHAISVNEIKHNLNDAMRYNEDRTYDVDRKRSDIGIELFDNIISNRFKSKTDYNKKVNYFNVYPSRSYTNIKSFNRELKAIDSSIHVIAFVKSWLQTKPTSNNMKRIEKLDRPMKRAVKKYYSPSVWFFVLKNALNKIRSNVVIDTDNLVVKFVKDEKEDGSIQDDVKKIEHVKDDNTNHKGGYNSNEVNSRTLRDGCIHCAKALLRKCFKTLKRSTKNTCRIYHCKSGFKSTFKSYSKTACLHEFTDDHKDDNRTLLHNFICKKKSRPLFVDSRRVGYVDFCKSSVTLREFDRFHESTSKDNAILNILRDKYDRACEKELYKKCSRACKCTIEATCDEHHCMKKKVKQLTKDCKAQCKTAFIKAESSESEESTDSSDEDTREDSEETE